MMMISSGDQVQNGKGDVLLFLCSSSYYKFSFLVTILFCSVIVNKEVFVH